MTEVTLTIGRAEANIITESDAGSFLSLRPVRAGRSSARCSPAALLPAGERIPTSLNTYGGQSWARM